MKTNYINPEKEFNHFLEGIKARGLDEVVVKKAWDFALLAHHGQKRKTGEPFVVHCLEVAKQLNDWYTKYQFFLKEKTINPITRRWFYTHKRIRSAYRSLKTNLPYLFIYQKYTELKIPNTTNSLDGYFSNLKTLLRIHRGLTKKRRFKVISEILNN